MLAFSTCWNNSRHTDGESMIDEIIEMGFDTIELSHGMTVAKYPGVQDAFKKGKFRCAGVHNYFPAPVEVMIDAPDAFEFTHKRLSDRKRAYDLTLRTLEVAAEFEARYVVLHMGSVPMKSAKWTKRLTQMVKDGQQLSPEYAKAKLDFVKKRESLHQPHYDRAIEALTLIAEKAQEVGVPVAIESRSRYEDVPDEREMVMLQEHFADNPWVGYWHDFGHVQLKNNLGLLNHEQWLTKMKDYLIGCHIHDVYWPDRDHRVTLTGEIDYQPLLAMFRDDMPITWELSPTRKKEDIIAAAHVFRQAFPRFCRDGHLQPA